MNNNWSKCILSMNNTVRDAIDNLTESSKKIVLVVSPDGNFQGTVSDGDIRRGLLRGIGLDSKLLEVIHTSPIVVAPSASEVKVKELMLAHRIQQIPIVDSAQKLYGLHEWDDLGSPPVRKNLFVIMAGGEGKRLLPHTLNIPKPMINVRGKPILEHIILRAKADGFQKFTIIVHHLSKVIEDYFQDGSNWGVSISYIKEDRPLGTAGGLQSLRDSIDEPMIVSNGDVISGLVYSDLLRFHSEIGATATMAVRQFNYSHPFGVISIEGSQIVEIQEKPTLQFLINAGIYVISKDSLELIDGQAPMNMTDLFEKLRTDGKQISAFPIFESWIDVGNAEDLEIARMETGDD